MNAIPIQDALDRVIAGVRTGELDLQLGLLGATVSQRRDTLEYSKGHSLAIGDTVVFNSKTKPRYMVGLRAKVLQVNQVTAYVDLLPGQRNAGKYSHSWRIRVPFALIDKVT